MTRPTNDRAQRRTLIAGAIVLSLIAAALLSPGTLFAPSPAGADLVSASGPFTILTAETINEDILLALDARAELLTVYRTDRLEDIQLVEKLSLPQLFSDARARFGRK